jgi:acyl-CoA synthetase (NDP forming)
MAVCGAGCMGFVNNVTGLRALGYLEPDPLPVGGVSLVTHSGSAFSTLLRARRGFGFRLAVSSGQELVTTTADYVDHILTDDGTSLIALLLETPRAVSRLRAGLRRAAEHDIPVVILRPVAACMNGTDRQQPKM